MRTVADASALKFPTVSCRETTHLEQKGDLALPVSQFSFQAFFLALMRLFRLDVHPVLSGDKPL